MSLQNAIGTFVALVGVFAYGQVKRLERTAKEEECRLADEDTPCVVPDATIEEPTG